MPVLFETFCELCKKKTAGRLRSALPGKLGRKRRDSTTAAGEFPAAASVAAVFVAVVSVAAALVVDSADSGPFVFCRKPESRSPRRRWPRPVQTACTLAR